MTDLIKEAERILNLKEGIKVSEVSEALVALHNVTEALKSKIRLCCDQFWEIDSLRRDLQRIKNKELMEALKVKDHIADAGKKVNSEQTGELWEYYCDKSYYDKWAVKLKSCKDFNRVIHVGSMEEAQFINRSFNELETLRATPDISKLLDSDIEFIFKQVERGLFDEHTTPEQALENIAYSPNSPWSKESKWDWNVDHLPYAKEFHNKFPKATIKVIKEKE